MVVHDKGAAPNRMPANSCSPTVNLGLHSKGATAFAANRLSLQELHRALYKSLLNQESLHPQNLDLPVVCRRTACRRRIRTSENDDYHDWSVMVQSVDAALG